MDAPNTLYYGDNLDILRHQIPDASVDLIYLDPPFNSKRDYNVLFKEKSGGASPAQIEAFTDTWAWDRAAEATYAELVQRGPEHVGKMIGALRGFLGTNDMMAYLVMMAARLGRDTGIRCILMPPGQRSAGERTEHMDYRRSTPIFALAIILIGLTSGGLAAKTLTPVGSPRGGLPATPTPAVAVTLRDEEGQRVGTATLTERDGAQVAISVLVEGLAPGEHGIHVHEVGRCDPGGEQPFSSAGGHYDPTEGAHGSPEGPESHAGDLGNIAADASGQARLETTSGKFALSPGPVSLRDADGSALLIHAERDDLVTDPAGNSGARVACGVIFAPAGIPTAGTPVVGTPAP